MKLKLTIEYDMNTYFFVELGYMIVNEKPFKAQYINAVLNLIKTDKPQHDTDLRQFIKNIKLYENQIDYFFKPRSIFETKIKNFNTI